MTGGPINSDAPAPAVLFGPILGLLNLAGSAAGADVATDRDALAPAMCFSSIAPSMATGGSLAATSIFPIS